MHSFCQSYQQVCVPISHFCRLTLFIAIFSGFQNGRFRGGPDGFNRGPGGFHRGPDGFGGDPRGGVDLGHLIGNIAANVGQEMGLNDADVIGDLRVGYSQQNYQNSLREIQRFSQKKTKQFY